MPKRSNIWQIWLPRGEGMLDGTMPCQICRDVRWNDARTLTVSLSEPVFALARAFFTPSATSQGSETAGSSLDDERSHSNCSLNLGSSRPAGGSIARRPKSVARVDPPAHLHLPVGRLNSDGPTPGKGSLHHTGVARHCPELGGRTIRFGSTSYVQGSPEFFQPFTIRCPRKTLLVSVTKSPSMPSEML
jgi:hypothetical protein